MQTLFSIPLEIFDQKIEKGLKFFFASNEISSYDKI